MPFIGNQPLTGQFNKLDAITAGANSLTDTYPLTKGSAAFFPATAEQLIVSVNGFYQLRTKIFFLTQVLMQKEF